MIHRDVVSAIARRLPHQTQREVREVLELLAEVWSDELVSGGEVTLPGVGRLSIELQLMKAGGAMQGHGQLRRIYGRFRPSQQLRAQLTRIEDTQAKTISTTRQHERRPS